MNAYEELQEAARAAVDAITYPPTSDPAGGREAASQALLEVILKVVGRVGHNVGVSGEADMNQSIRYGDDEAAGFAVFSTGTQIDDEAYLMRHNLGLEQ